MLVTGKFCFRNQILKPILFLERKMYVSFLSFPLLYGQEIVVFLFFFIVFECGACLERICHFGSVWLLRKFWKREEYCYI